MSRKIGNVLSLFDGMSCGRQALEKAEIKIGKYYASEIDKYAIQVAQHNYPDTIQLGSVTEVDVADLEPIGLLIGGSPCQSFSFAGKRNGMTTSCNEEIYSLERYLELKADGFQFEGESYLFWEYMRILTDIRKYNPNVLFLLENVEMGSKWERVLSEAIGVYGVHINSALVSAQNRKRIYWTNIRVKEVGLFGELHSDIPQPEDRGILLKDILEDNVDEKYYLSEKMLKWLDKHSDKRGIGVKKLDGEQKTACLTATAQVKQNLSTDYVCVAMRGRNPDNPSDRTTGAPTERRIEPRRDGKTNTITSVQKDNLVMQLNPSKESGGVQPYQHNRCYDINGISPCLNTDARPPSILIPEATANRYEGSLTAAQLAKFNPDVDASKHNALTQAVGRGGSSSEYMDSVSKVSNLSSRIRRLTPVECERLQTVEDNYSACVSDTQRYKMLGNGWSVEVIKHIFSFI